MNLDDQIRNVEITGGKHELAAERAQAIKFVLRQGTNWPTMSISNKEALEVIASAIAIILEGDMNDHQNWDRLARLARARGIALDVPMKFKLPGMDAAEASIDDDIRTVAGKFAPRAT